MENCKTGEELVAKIYCKIPWTNWHLGKRPNKSPRRTLFVFLCVSLLKGEGGGAVCVGAFVLGGKGEESICVAECQTRGLSVSLGSRS